MNMAKKSSGSSRRERQRQMKNSDITYAENLLKKLVAIKHRKIDLSDKDAPEITDWENAVLGKFYRPIKKQITVRIDADILNWFRHASDKYQTLINQACREYMERHQSTKIVKKKKA